jgi:4a-hydroxytetrahydrobiopterin dehydratase
MTRSPAPSTASEISAALDALPGWRHEGDALRKTFQLETFRDAMALLVRIGFEAEERNHHPEIFNVYGKIEITLRTHDAANRVTALDLDLAKIIEQLAAGPARPPT